MAKTKPNKGGRPPSDAPKKNKHMIRLDDDEEQDALADIERLTLITGTDWNISSYARMCMREMKGKHLAPTSTKGKQP